MQTVKQIGNKLRLSYVHIPFSAGWDFKHVKYAQKY